jgi:hypothetical protein
MHNTKMHNTKTYRQFLYRIMVYFVWIMVMVGGLYHSYTSHNEYVARFGLELEQADYILTEICPNKSHPLHYAQLNMVMINCSLAHTNSQATQLGFLTYTKYTVLSYYPRFRSTVTLEVDIVQKAFTNVSSTVNLALWTCIIVAVSMTLISFICCCRCR